MRKREKAKKKQRQDLLSRIGSIAAAILNVLRLVLYIWDRWFKH